MVSSTDTKMFFGRENEIEQLRQFIKSDEKNIFCLYGVAMIGKSVLVREFINRNEALLNELNYSHENRKIVEFKNPGQKSPILTLISEILVETPIDTLVFENPTLIILKNFEVCLNGYGHYKEKLKIKREYKQIKEFLNRIAIIPNVKLIIESRFQLNPIELDEFQLKTLENVELEGIPSSLFWNLYKEAGVSKEDFEIICKNFSDHTGLLALAYKNQNHFFKNRLFKAANYSKRVTEILWSQLEYIIADLHEGDQLILCGLTLKTTFNFNELEDEMEMELIDFDTTTDECIYSLEQKFLIHVDEDDVIQLNPFLQEICFTHFQKSNLLKTIYYRLFRILHLWKNQNSIFINNCTQGVIG